MERVYLNARAGERRIHVEIDETEIPELIAEFAAPASAPARRLVEILDATHERFGGKAAGDGR